MFISIFQDFILASALLFYSARQTSPQIVFNNPFSVRAMSGLWPSLASKAGLHSQAILHHRHSRVMHLRCSSYSPSMGSRVQDLATSPPWQKATHAPTAPSPPSHIALYFDSEGRKGGASTGTKDPGDLKMWEVPLTNGCLHFPWDGKMSH